MEGLRSSRNSSYIDSEAAIEMRNRHPAAPAHPPPLDLARSPQLATCQNVNKMYYSAALGSSMTEIQARKPDRNRSTRYVPSVGPRACLLRV